MTVVYQHPREVKKFVFDMGPNFEFTPSDEHVASIPLQIDTYEIETGQFDDV